MSEYVFRYASGYGCDMSDLMDGGRVTVGDYFASESTDHYGTLHEEIVRCRDCVYAINGGEYCAEEVKDDFYWRNVEPDGFCAWGERRGEGDNE